jgi:acyl dehydratase
LKHDLLLGWDFPTVEQRYDDADTILYALAVGLGSDPTDPAQLRFLYEEGLLALPTLPCVLASPGFWASEPQFEIDWKSVLHGEQSIELHAPVPPSGRVQSTMRITDIIDKGPGVGAIVYSERVLVDADTGGRIATLGSTTVCRAEGGYGGPSRRINGRGQTAPDLDRPPARPPDHVAELPTLPQSALLYRLTGDRNPLHADPVVARAAGFLVPILHGLCTFAVAGYALLRDVCAYESGRLRFMDARFAAPVLPGETIRTRIWDEPQGLRFEATAGDGDDERTVLSRGFALVDEPFPRA